MTKRDRFWTGAADREGDDGRDQLRRAVGEAEALKHAQYDEPTVEPWRITAEAILGAHFGEDHELTVKWRRLRFREQRIISFSDSAPLTREEHNRAYQTDLNTAVSILHAAETIWAASKPGSQPPPAVHFYNSPVMTNTNNNTNTANSSSSAVASVEFPLDRLQALVDQDDVFTEEQRTQAKDHLEDLDLELRKKQPRWEKIKGHLRPLIEGGRDFTIQLLAAVAAAMIKGE